MNLRTALIFGTVGVVFLSVLFVENIDCKQANPNNPKMCQDGKPFLLIICIVPAGIVLLGTAITLENKQQSKPGVEHE